MFAITAQLTRGDNMEEKEVDEFTDIFPDDLADLFPWLPRGQYKRVKGRLPCSEQKSDKPQI
jgi:hypothetical protein